MSDLLSAPLQAPAPYIEEDCFNNSCSKEAVYRSVPLSRPWCEHAPVWCLEHTEIVKENVGCRTVGIECDICGHSGYTKLRFERIR